MRYLAALLFLLIALPVSAQVAFPNRGGLGTSTSPTVGQVPVGCLNSSSQFVYCPQATSTLGLLPSSVATGTVSGSSQISVTSNRYVFGGNLAIDIVGDSIGDSQLAFNTGQNLTALSSPTFADLNLTNLVVSTNSTLGTVISGLWNGTAIDISSYTNLTAGDALTLTGDDIDFDGGATPQGDLGGTWASPTVDDVTCTDCLGTTEIADSYLLNTTDTGTGAYTLGDGTQAGGLTVSGGATTTLNHYIGGSLGIGASSPTHNLHVQSLTDAAIFLEADTDNATETDNPFIKFTQDNAAVEAILGLSGGSNIDPANVAYTGAISNAILLGGNTTLEALQFGTNDTVRMTISATGNVGIGTTTPAQRLAVSNTSNQLYLNDSNSTDTSSTGGTLFSTNDGVLTLQGLSSAGSGSALRLVIDQVSGDAALGGSISSASTFAGSSLVVKGAASGNVGISTTSPFAKLSIQGLSGSSPLFTVASSTSGAATSTALHITSDGKVGIGDHLTPANLLEVYGATGNGIRIHTNDSTAETTANLFFENRSGDASEPKAGIISEASGGSWGLNKLHIALDGTADTSIVDLDDAKLTVMNSGNVGIGNTTPTSKLYVNGDITAANLLATSTTATSTFAGGLTVDGNDFIVEPDAGQVSVGITPSTLGTQKFAVYNNVSGTSGTINAGVMRSDFTGSATSSATISGLYAIAQLHPSATQGISGTLNGVLSQVANADTGLVTTARGIYTDLSNNTGTITNTYGVVVGDVTSGTQTNTAYSFYATDVNAFNYFGGNTGIGTTTPISKLHVFTGTASLFSQTADSLLVQSSSDTDWLMAIESQRNNSANQKLLRLVSDTLVGTSNNFEIANSAGTYFVANNAGTIGVGTTSPWAKLSVQGLSGSAPLFTVASSTSGAATSTAFHITADGKLQVGTSFKLPASTTPIVNEAGQIGVDLSPPSFCFATSTSKACIPDYDGRAFNIASSSWTTTTTAEYATLDWDELITGGRCYTDAGTVLVRVGDGTNFTNAVSITTSTTTVTFTSNNLFKNGGEKVIFQVGTPASNPTRLSCNFRRYLQEP